MPDLRKFLILIVAAALALAAAGCSSAPSDSKAGSDDVQTQNETVIPPTDDVTVIDLSSHSETVLLNQGGVYLLTGSLSGGQIVIDAAKDDSVELIMSGASVTSNFGAAVYCRQAKELMITLTDDSENFLTDASVYHFDDPAGEEPDAALFSKSDITIRGNGTLTVEGRYKHGIVSKDDLRIKSGTINVTSVSDALRGKDSVTAEGGTVNIRAGKDGIAATNGKEENKGLIEISGGIFVITSSGDAIQAETSLKITEGDFTITTEGQSSGSSESQKGIKAKELLQIDGGKFQLFTQDDAIHSDLDVTISGGEFYIETDDDGVHADRDLVINDGRFNIPVCYEGMEGTTVTVNGGNIFIDARDDAIGAAAGTAEAQAMNDRSGNPAVRVSITGGEIEAVSGGDTVDSNGDIFVSGGKLRLSSPADPYYEGVLLCNGRVTVTGGDLAMAGNIGVELTVENQPMLLISYRDSQPKGSVISLRDKSGNIVLEALSRKDYSQAIFSSPELKTGMTYTVYVDERKITDVTLSGMINKAADDGGEFTGGYPRGHW